MEHLILYAEDDKDWAEMYIKDFRDNGYDVVWTKNGQEAIDKYKERSPDIILLDIIMPVLDGYQVAEEIRRKDPYTPIFFFTTLSDTNDAIKGLSLDVNDYVRKDIELNELFAKMQNAIRRNPVKQSPVIQITPDTVLDTAVKKINSCGDSYSISFRDCNLLRILVQNKNIPQKRNLLIKQVWDDNSNGEDYLSKSISLLRKILSGNKRIQLIANRGDSVVLIVKES